MFDFRSQVYRYIPTEEIVRHIWTFLANDNVVYFEVSITDALTYEPYFAITKLGEVFEKMTKAQTIYANDVVLIDIITFFKTNDHDSIFRNLEQQYVNNFRKKMN